jgi:hypothetical protein
MRKRTGVGALTLGHLSLLRAICPISRLYGSVIPFLDESIGDLATVDIYENGQRGHPEVQRDDNWLTLREPHFSLGMFRICL